MLNRIRDQLQLDRPLAYTFVARAWNAISGPITLVLLLRALTPQEQGVYYSIVTIAGFQNLLELGLLSILIVQAGHEFAVVSDVRRPQQDDLTFANQSVPSAEGRLSRAKYRLRLLIEGAERWFMIAGTLFFICASAIGYDILQNKASGIAWQWPLGLVLFFTFVTMALSPSLAILEGAGEREAVYRYRFIQIVLGSVCVWAAFGLGWRLWSLVLASGVQAMMSAIVVFGYGRSFFSEYRHAPVVEDRFSWWYSVIPLQWRAAVLSVAYHIATQVFVLIVLLFHSSAEAGQLGATLSITGAIQMLALTWVQTKLAVASHHHGTGNRESAGTMWRRAAVLSTGILIAALATFLVIVWSLPWLQLGLESRFISTWPLLLLSLGNVSNHLVAVQGYYIMSRRSLPLLRANLIGCIGTAAAVWIGGYCWSTVGIAVGYCLATTCVTLPLHSMAYFSYRRI